MSLSAPSVLVPNPHLIVRGQDTSISAPVYRDGQIVPVSAGTVTIRGPHGTIVDAAAVAPDASGVATYTVLGTDTSDQQLGDRGWTVDWTLTTAAAEPLVFTSAAAIVRVRLHPVIAAADLYRRVPALDPASRSSITRDDPGTSHQWAIDESWHEIEAMLLAGNRRPWLVLSPGALRLAHLHLALALVYDDLATRQPDGPYADRAEVHRSDARAAWDRVALEYDSDRDGEADGRKRSAASTVWLGVR